MIIVIDILTKQTKFWNLEMFQNLALCERGVRQPAARRCRPSRQVCKVNQFKECAVIGIRLYNLPGVCQDSRNERVTLDARSSHTYTSLSQIRNQRQHVPRHPSYLLVPVLVRADDVEQDVPHAGGVKAADAVRHPFRRTERGVALGGAAEIHGIALAQADGCRLERLLIGAAEPGEQQMPGAEARERASRGGG